jgi:hypothetical protein
MSEKTCTELVVRDVGELQTSPNGHPYVECRVDGGVVAFWGSPRNMGHIDEVRRAKPPFRIICDCIPSRWSQHDLWVYERHDIYMLEPIDVAPAATATPPAAGPAVSLQELAEWRRRIAAWVASLEAGRGSSTDGLAGRIGALSYAGTIPREIAALMKAVTEMRNATEYDSKVLSKVESLAVRNSWLAVSDWAATKGLAT